jgi:hypothetical protein
MEGHSEVELGYRWVSGAGNRDMYRSMVNLGEGPKLLRSSLSLRAAYGAGALFDRLDLSMNNWGGDPYNTLALHVGRAEVSDFRAGYRNLNYYNFVPAFANPLLAAGRLLGQHSLNVTQRSTDLELKLFPSRRLRPFFAYSRTSGFGPGYTTFQTSGNEFLLGTNWRYRADEYRGGLELELPRLAVTFDQGVRLLANDSAVASGTDRGANFVRPVLGEPIVLDGLNRGYHDRTTMPVSRLMAKATPWSILSVTARYLYAVADVDSRFSQIERGSFVSLEDLLYYRTAADAFDTHARRPTRTGGFLIELAPFDRLTITDEFDARSFDVTGSAFAATTFLGIRPISSLPDGRNDRTVQRTSGTAFAYDQSRNQAEAELELARGFSLRGGHRYTRVDVAVEQTEAGRTERDTGSYVQQTALAGVAFRRGRWLRLGLDYENNRSEHALTRTDLLDYDQIRFSWQLRPGKRFSASGRIGFLRNSNPAADIDFTSHNRNYAFEVTYDPGERLSLALDYSRSNLFSNILILLPQTLDSDRSVFDERSHAVGGSLGVTFYRGARVDLGYRGIASAGSYPLNHHQPFAGLSIPLQRSLVWRTHWQYVGYNEKGAAFQDHRTHLVTFSLAYLY